MKKTKTITTFFCNFCHKEIENMEGGLLVRNFTRDDFRTDDPLVHDPQKDSHFHTKCWAPWVISLANL